MQKANNQMAIESTLLEKTFHLSEQGTTVKREILAGLTTFVSMAYILFVNPSILGAAGMDKGAVFTATALSAILGSVLMAFLANYPIAVAPGLGDNAFFTFSVVLGMGISWQKAMAGVFIASVLFTILSFLKVREIVIDAIPKDLKLAMAAGIGIFIAFVGLQGGGLVVASKTSLVEIGSLAVPTTWLTIFGIFVIAILMAKKVPGSIFIGLVSTALLGLITGLIKMPANIISLAPSMKPTFGVGISYLPSVMDPQMWAVVLIFLLVAFFDTAGTLIGLAQQAGIIKDNKMPRIGQALMADSVSMLAGSVMGTTPTAAYVESSAGIAIGGKTGLTSLTVSILFVFSMFFSPLLTVVTNQVTAPALIVVGVLMASSLREIDWGKFEIAMPAFLTIVGMPLTYNISYGIAFGFLTYPILMFAAGRRKEVNYIMWILLFVFVLLLYVLNIVPKS
ncbi:NCS2 family permease [Pediococcus pentosaceus]|jgi:AGZA family xanthine/uracil permease-like MFS transporter|uniref:NCS2 family permease n=1 Tax=Pediococcus pentosaceus TaxID=1255 RepID=A0A6N7BT17_PEDPE|nr:NCS2 family permease [Pediococcus pentosaceus]AHA04777.1 guanine permease [Pediococcus pentosaceus SL4]KAF0350968.1 NCS2 family permease [Pediococcus pentosaceus]KAF0413632.1 NCS2 family permease [Pediococcus pentosaceus]KAF0421959.1 NCS2 family permease [Pediococcus pentosaceus]KAF0503945.1 NCS2 family permease [Pediococcus pentosaceus]